MVGNLLMTISISLGDIEILNWLSGLNLILDCGSSLKDYLFPFDLPVLWKIGI